MMLTFCTTDPSMCSGLGVSRPAPRTWALSSSITAGTTSASSFFGCTLSAIGGWAAIYGRVVVLHRRRDILDLLLLLRLHVVHNRRVGGIHADAMLFLLPIKRYGEHVYVPKLGLHLNNKCLLALPFADNNAAK
jgi:hypothetical protein